MLFSYLHVYLHVYKFGEKKVISSFRCRMHSYILACELRYTCTCTFKSSIDCQEIPMLFKNIHL